MDFELVLRRPIETAALIRHYPTKDRARLAVVTLWIPSGRAIVCYFPVRAIVALTQMRSLNP